MVLIKNDVRIVVIRAMRPLLLQMAVGWSLSGIVQLWGSLQVQIQPFQMVGLGLGQDVDVFVFFVVALSVCVSAVDAHRGFFPPETPSNPLQHFVLCSRGERHWVTEKLATAAQLHHQL